MKRSLKSLFLLLPIIALVWSISPAQASAQQSGLVLLAPDLTVEDISWGGAGFVVKAKICNRGNMALPDPEFVFKVNGQESKVWYPPGIGIGECQDHYSGLNDIAFGLEHGKNYSVEVSTRSMSGMAESSMANNKLVKTLLYGNPHPVIPVCEANLPADTVIVDGQLDSSASGKNFLVKRGGRLTNILGSNNIFIEEGGYADTGDSSQNLIYVPKGAGFYNRGQTTNKIFYELGANLSNRGAGSTLVECAKITYVRGTLSRPQLGFPRNESNFTNYPRTITFTWSPVSGADSYLLEVDCLHCARSGKWSSEMGEFYFRKQVSQTSLDYTFPGDNRGRWRVKAADKSGRESEWSDWNYFAFNTQTQPSPTPTPTPTTTPTPTPAPTPAPIAKPVLTSPKDGSFFTHYPRTTTLEWQGLNNVDKYIVEVDCFHCHKANNWSADLGQVYRREEVVGHKSYVFDFVGNQQGRWRVRGVDASGKQGPPSDWWYFTYDSSRAHEKADLTIVRATINNNSLYHGDQPIIKAVVKNVGQSEFKGGKVFIRAEDNYNLPGRSSGGKETSWGFSDTLSPEETIPVNGERTFVISGPTLNRSEGDHAIGLFLEYPDWAYNLDGDHSNDAYGPKINFTLSPRGNANPGAPDFWVDGFRYLQNESALDAKICMGRGNRTYADVPVIFSLPAAAYKVNNETWSPSNATTVTLSPGRCEIVKSWNLNHPLFNGGPSLQDGKEYSASVIVDHTDSHTETDESNNIKNLTFTYRSLLRVLPAPVIRPIKQTEVSAAGLLKKDLLDRYSLIDLEGNFLATLAGIALDEYLDKGIRVRGIADRSSRSINVRSAEVIQAGSGSLTNDILVKYDLGSTLYRDVDTNDHDIWYVPYLSPLYGKGIFTGYSDGRFGGANHLSVAELAKVAVVSAGIILPETDANPNWAYLYMMAAKENGLFDDIDYNNFESWEAPATRLQAVKAVLRAHGLRAEAPFDCFPDIRDSEACRAKDLGIISGYPDGSFGPNDWLLRSQMVKIIFKAMEVAARLGQ